MASYENVPGIRTPRALPVAAVVAAYHAGLQDFDRLRDQLNSTERNTERTRLEAFRGAATHDQPKIAEALAEAAEACFTKGPDLLLRMLLSCLVDADRLDTAGRANVQAPLRASDRLFQLQAHL